MDAVFWTNLLMITGSLFMLLAAVGIVRMPDLFTRMHAATKVGTMGVSGLMLAVAIAFNDLGTTTRALLIILFFLITAPVGAHMIGRSAYLSGVKLWSGTRINEWPAPGEQNTSPPDTHEQDRLEG